VAGELVIDVPLAEAEAVWTTAIEACFARRAA
jgi:hypothetical protein